ncbi:glycosyltransferase [Flavobacterium gawalongense]|uniref:Glycosyltransferase n=1 Tax=Flavobacterium gawalongense TaxID=2594432 RepID=A0A553BZ36_9FLAO|nr:glycosyltransferase [Flavobacterium gawalongense]TRX04561.1 glycosyltransferase [Flavobacterium gawalongense]TRX10448.1 glycosyltransferase [Flavobacterium gawalongense]TRX13494.1 glycosyltransferase [Flavobacterium gawalongense]TRX15574.1 glycosyltransferase [Flavobacterium gawalongense]TRX31413.1 glycosyltransferase [Flavobacterium gawalongense]
MTLVIITHVAHCIEQNKYFAYAPYVREMNIWTQYADRVIIVAPKTDLEKTPIESAYEHKNIELVAIDSFDILSLKEIFKTIISIPKISWNIFKTMRKADHIHLRCPGNIGLLGCLIQILFPNTPKTAKYAGNWDPKSKQSLTYKLQQLILRNIFLTRNIQVLVYGKWEGSTKNIKSFFTATYAAKDKLPLTRKDVKEKINFVFMGALVMGKNPLYAIQLVELMSKKGYDVMLRLYGEGIERKILEDYITVNHLKKNISLEGNQTQEIIKNAYKESHFVILPSDSEGWPKVIAEGMFWGCVPVATSVSCVPFMLDYGERGVLLEMNLEEDGLQIETLLHHQMDFDIKRNNAAQWSRGYTLDVFEQEIEKLLNCSRYNL